MMHEIEQINKLLDEVSKRNAIELKLNHDGTGGLQLKTGVQLYFEYIKDKGRLYIYTPVMPIPPDEGRRAALYEAMLECNFLNLGCEAGGLAIFRHTAQAVYQTGLEVKSLSADRLHQAIEEFLGQRDEVIFQLEQSEAEGGKPAQAHRPGASTFNRLALQVPRRNW